MIFSIFVNDKENIFLADSAFLNVGTGNDLSLTHDGTDSTIANITGDLNMTNTNTGSGGNISITANGDTTAGDITITNSNSVAGSDIIFALGTENLAAQADTAYRFQTSDNTWDMFSMTNDTVTTFNFDGDTTDGAVGSFTINVGDDAMTTLTPMFSITPGASSTEALTTFGTGNDVLLNDSVELRLGSTATTGDLVIVHDGTNSTVTNGTGALTTTNNGTGDLGFVNTAGGNISLDNQFATGDILLTLGADSADETIQFQNNSGTLVQINGDGPNSTSTTTGTMTITGGLGVSQDVYAQSFKASSDATLKENIEPLTDALRTLHKIDGYQYDWIDRDESTPKQWGVLAQQLEEAGLEHMVSDGKVKAVNYLFLIPLLIESVKELTKLTLDDVEEE